jgi:hypothetical protein
MHNVESMNGLVTGPAFRFAGWPNDQVPRRAAGVYTIWRQEEFIYVGMSGREPRLRTLSLAPAFRTRPSGCGPG